MGEVIYVLVLLDDPPSREFVADVLRFCNDGVPPDHPYYDDIALSDAELADTVNKVIDGGERINFQYGTEETSGARAFDYRMGVNQSSLTDLPHLVIYVNDTYFRTDSQLTDDEEVYEASAALRGFICDLYASVGQDEPSLRYMCAIDDGDIAHASDKEVLVSRAGIDASQLETLVWCQLLPPELAGSIGYERLRSAPAWRVKELDDGAVFLVVDEVPKLPQAGLETNRQAVVDHFGIESA